MLGEDVMKTSMRRVVGLSAVAAACLAVTALVAVPLIQAQLIPPIVPPTDPTDPTDPPDQDPTGNERQPTISGDGQFTTLTSGALQNRAPGNYIQQGIAVNNGNLNMFDGNVVDNPSFIGETFEMIMLDILEIINQFLSLINPLISGSNPLSGLLPGGTNSLTNLLTGGTGSGGSVTIR